MRFGVPCASFGPNSCRPNDIRSGHARCPCTGLEAHRRDQALGTRGPIHHEQSQDRCDSSDPRRQYVSRARRASSTPVGAAPHCSNGYVDHWCISLHPDLGHLSALVWRRIALEWLRGLGLWRWHRCVGRQAWRPTSRSYPHRRLPSAFRRFSRQRLIHRASSQPTGIRDREGSWISDAAPTSEASVTCQCCCEGRTARSTTQQRFL